jgi:hypothetical protein
VLQNFSYCGRYGGASESNKHGIGKASRGEGDVTLATNALTVGLGWDTGCRYSFLLLDFDQLKQLAIHGWRI